MRVLPGMGVPRLGSVRNGTPGRKHYRQSPCRIGACDAGDRKLPDDAPIIGSVPLGGPRPWATAIPAGPRRPACMRPACRLASLGLCGTGQPGGDPRAQVVEPEPRRHVVAHGAEDGAAAGLVGDLVGAVGAKVYRSPLEASNAAASAATPANPSMRLPIRIGCIVPPLSGVMP